MDSMVFDLDLSVARAEQQMRQFLQRAEGDIKKLQQSVEKAMGLSAKPKQQQSWADHNKREADKVEAYNRRMMEKRDRDVQRSFNREVQAAKNSAEQITAFKIRQNAQLKSNDQLTADVKVRLEQQLANDLVRIQAERVGKSSRILSAELSAARMAHQQRVRMFQTMMPAGGGAPGAGGKLDAGRFNKLNQMAFQGQQIIEDASFSGWKGASNNLAFMAAQLGGTGGLIAMGGIAAVTVGMLAKSMLGLETDTERANRQLEQFVDRSKELSDRRMESMQRFGTADLGAGPGEFLGKSAAAQQEAQRALAESIKAAEDKRKVERLAEAQKQMWLDTWSVGASHNEKEASIKAFEKAAKAAGVDRKVGKGDIFGLGFPGGNLVDTDKMLSEAAKHLQDLEDKFGSASREATDYKAIADMAGRVGDEFERAAKAAGELGRVHIRDTAFSSADALAERRRKEEDALADHIKQQSKAMGLDTSKAQLGDLQNQYGIAKEGNDLPKMNELLKQIEAEYAKIATDQESLTAGAQRWADEHSKVLIELTQVVAKEAAVRQEIEGQISATKRLIEADTERIERLKEAKDSSKHDTDTNLFGVKLGLIGGEADEAIRKAQEHAEKFGLDADPVIKRIRQRQKADEKKMLDEREQFLKGRGQSQGEAAQDALDKGEFGRAEGEFGKQRDTLRELERLQTERAQSGDIGDRKKAAKRLEETGGAIGDTFDAELEAAKQRKAQDEADMTSLKAQLEAIDAIKAQTESRQFVTDADLEAAQALKAELESILAIATAIGEAQKVGGAEFGGAGIPGHAAGGPVSAGGLTWVGEAGKELFLPATDGFIFNTNDSRGLMQSVAALIAAGDAGGTRPHSTTNNMPVSQTVNLLGGPDLVGMARAAAMQAKQSRIRRS